MNGYDYGCGCGYVRQVKRYQTGRIKGKNNEVDAQC